LFTCLWGIVIECAPANRPAVMSRRADAAPLDLLACPTHLIYMRLLNIYIYIYKNSIPKWISKCTATARRAVHRPGTTLLTSPLLLLRGAERDVSIIYILEFPVFLCSNCGACVILDSVEQIYIRARDPRKLYLLLLEIEVKRFLQHFIDTHTHTHTHTPMAMTQATQLLQRKLQYMDPVPIKRDKCLAPPALCRRLAHTK